MLSFTVILINMSVPGLCGDGAVFDQGQCHHLGSQGHCQDGAYLAISSSSLEPECFQKKVYFTIDSRFQILSIFNLLDSETI